MLLLPKREARSILKLCARPQNPNLKGVRLSRLDPIPIYTIAIVYTRRRMRILLLRKSRLNVNAVQIAAHAQAAAQAAALNILSNKCYSTQDRSLENGMRLIS